MKIGHKKGKIPKNTCSRMTNVVGVVLIENFSLDFKRGAKIIKVMLWSSILYLTFDIGHMSPPKINAKTKLTLFVI